MQARIAVAEMFHFQVLDRLDDRLRDELGAFPDTGNGLHGVDQAGGGGAEQVCRLAGDDPAVVQFDRDSRTAGLLGALKSGDGDLSVGRGNAGGRHQQLDLFQLGRLGKALQNAAGGGVVAADDFLL